MPNTQGPSIDPEKARRENLRWYILLTLNAARPIGTSEAVVLSTVQGIVTDCTPRELRNELDYLCHRDLITLERRDTPIWHAELTRLGIDVTEYTVACDAGIARPQKYW
jgi:hypothetical protein